MAVKRLRYLREGFGRAARSATSVLAQLTALQHLFGELHDAQVLQHWLLEVRPARKRIGSDTRGGAGRQVHRAIRSPASSAVFMRLAALTRRLERAGLNGNRPAGTGPSLRANSRDIHRRFSRGQ